LICTAVGPPQAASTRTANGATAKDVNERSIACPSVQRPAQQRRKETMFEARNPLSQTAACAGF
jgi:hypothetical protein